MGVTLRTRIYHEGGAIGPGKIALLEAIARTGSISGAGRSLDMSYRRAWFLIETMNAVFRHPVVATSVGGKDGGGAALTPFGEEVVARFRALEASAADATADALAWFDDATVDEAPRSGVSDDGTERAGG